MRTRRWLATICVCFAARLAFYASAFPLWEGFDEWAHFALVRAVALDGQMLARRGATLPLDVAASLNYAPVASSLANLPADVIPHHEFWSLPAEERSRREADFRRIPAEFARRPSDIASQHTPQAPVYYWLMAPVLWAARGASLSTQVFLLRGFSILIATLIIPLVFLIGRAVFEEDRVALGCAAMVALMPELAVDMARVSNECLAVVLYTAVIWLAIQRRSGWILGVLLGIGLITKAYFLAALAGVAVVLWAPRAFALAILISGWWYGRNLWTTGSATGLREAVMLGGSSLWSVLQDADSLPWKQALDSILLSHLYLGGWSYLTVDHRVYHVLFIVIAVAGVGALLVWRKQQIRSLIFIYAAFWMAQLYSTVLTFVAWGVPASLGWYLYAVIGAQAALTIAGLRRVFGGAGIWIAAVLCGALDLYAMHAVALPYYTGMLSQPPTRAAAIRGWGDLSVSEVFSRLAVFKPVFLTQGALMALWVLYLAATVALVAVAVRLSRGVKRA
jgi:hypothetical protein